MTMALCNYKAKVVHEQEAPSLLANPKPMVVASNSEPSQSMVSKVAYAAGTIILSPILVPVKIISLVGRAVSTQKPKEEKTQEILTNDWEDIGLKEVVDINAAPKPVNIYVSLARSRLA